MDKKEVTLDNDLWITQGNDTVQRNKKSTRNTEMQL